MTYQFAAGYNNAGSLADVSVQPRSTGITDGRRLLRGDGLVVADGFGRSEWLYGFLRKDVRYIYNTLLTEFGLTSATSAECTIAMPNNETRAFTNYNAVIVRPDLPDDAEWSGGKLVEVRFVVQRIRAI